MTDLVKEDVTGMNFTCTCEKPKFLLAEDGKSCEPVHPCDQGNSGGCEQKCLKKGSEARCSCEKPKFLLAEDGKSCEPVHPCDQGNNAGCEHTCLRKGSEARCSCEKGFTLEEDGKSCEKGRYNQAHIFPCSCDVGFFSSLFARTW